MSSESPDENTHHDRTALLANGDVVSLAAAIGNYGLLKSHLLYPETDSEPGLVHALRQICLGQDATPEQRKELIRQRLLENDGHPKPEMRSVVLSSVRGEGRLLHISSPFTDPLDQAIAEFYNAAHYLMSHLPREEAKELFADATTLDDRLSEALKYRAQLWKDEGELDDVLRRLGLNRRPSGPAGGHSPS